MGCSLERKKDCGFLDQCWWDEYYSSYIGFLICFLFVDLGNLLVDPFEAGFRAQMASTPSSSGRFPRARSSAKNLIRPETHVDDWSHVDAVCWNLSNQVDEVYQFNEPVIIMSCKLGKNLTRSWSVLFVFATALPC